MASKSRIFFTTTTGTQTDSTSYSPVVPMVMIPFDQYEAMAKVYYGKLAQDSLINPANNTEISKNTNTGHSDICDSKVEMSKSASASSVSITEKDIQDNNKGQMKPKRLKSIIDKYPILTSRLLEKKTADDHADTLNLTNDSPLFSSASSSSAKRSNDAPIQQAKRKHVSAASSSPYEVNQHLSSEIPVINDNISDEEDLETWCLSKAIQLMDDYKYKKSLAYGHRDRKD